MSTNTELFVSKLEALKEGDLSLFRALRGQRLDESLKGFDVFTGVWWALRQLPGAVPRREIAWLVIKLYAIAGLKHKTESSFASCFGRVYRTIEEEKARNRFLDRFDDMLNLDLSLLEYPLQMALLQIKNERIEYIDWIKLTDDLSKWDNEHTRSRWAQEFYNAYKFIN